jgi:hypothetical protein
MAQSWSAKASSALRATAAASRTSSGIRFIATSSDVRSIATAIVNAVRNSRLKPVEAPEVVLDGEDIDSAEAGLGGVAADRVGADHGAGAGGVVVE